jgi:hypothetical protein
MSGAIAIVVALALFALPSGGISTVQAADPGACGNVVIDVPDTGSVFNFVDACMGHDACYSEGGTEADRTGCDNAFLDAMETSCDSQWATQRFKHAGCYGVAYTYYLGVRIGGWAFFPYS